MNTQARTKLISAALTICTLLTLCTAQTRAQESANAERYFSPSVAQSFYQVAYELAHNEDVTTDQGLQALIFLNAAEALDTRADYVLPEMISLISRFNDPNYAELMNLRLHEYINKSADLEVANAGLSYMLEQLDSIEDRTNLLAKLAQNLRGKNPAFESELHTMLGLLNAEIADSNTALSFFLQAYNNNKYNKVAFNKIAELAPDQIDPAVYLAHLRRLLIENPLNIDIAITFADYAEQVQLFQTGADAYRYCAELFTYLYPDQPLPQTIYLPWALTNYNTQRNQHACLKIAEQIRQTGRFDLALETVAAKAAAKIGNQPQADQIFAEAAQKAETLFFDTLHSETPAITADQIAWFYCFGQTDTERALDWANKAYSSDPNSPVTAAILAYTLVANGQIEWAKPLIEGYEHNTVTSLTLARVQLAEDDRDSAIKTLKSVIDQDPASLEADMAKQILSEQNADYIPAIDPDIIETVLVGTFGQALVPAFTSPERMLSVQLNVRGSKFYYGSDFGGTISIQNISSGPLVISDDSLFTGHIRIDASVSGDITEKIPNLFSLRVRPPSPVEPGKSILLPIRLLTGRLRDILLNHPQASLNIEFTIYIDPVITTGGIIANRFADIEPAKTVINRPAKVLSTRFLQNRLKSISTGRQGQKIKIARLFICLLAEQDIMANREPLYKFMYADWMPEILKSALVQNLDDDDWVVKANTTAAMLALPLDYQLTEAFSENLQDTHWPVRLITLYLLAESSRSTSFKDVLDWTAKYDSNDFVRGMAFALGATQPAPVESNTPAIQ